MTEALKPCPFCGVAPEARGNKFVDGGIMVFHPSKTGCALNGHYMPIGKWNHPRTIPATPSATAMQQALEALKWIATPLDESLTFGSCSMWCAREARAKARAAIPALEAAMQPSEKR
jgi:hypothetical protein